MKDNHIGARVDDALLRRLGEICNRYEMNESQVIRLCLRYGIDEIEANGIDGLVADQPAPE